LFDVFRDRLNHVSSRGMETAGQGSTLRLRTIALSFH
jgi:hypothetical protein